METVLVSGASAAALTIILCYSAITARLRKLPILRKVLACSGCTSFWASVLFNPSLTCLATMAVAMLILSYIVVDE